MNFSIWYQKQTGTTNVPTPSIEAVLALAAEGATVPFISRYRKERTGNLDEVQVQSVIDEKVKWDDLLKRKEFVLSEIKKQDKLTPELEKKIQECFAPLLLEDIYLPYKQKRKTKATLAREAGLEPLAEWIWSLAHKQDVEESELSVDEMTKKFLNPDKKVATLEEALQGAVDILTERLAENLTLREHVRTVLQKEGAICTSKGKNAKTPSKFENYFDFHEPIKSLLNSRNSHRYLAIKRGWHEGEISVKITQHDQEAEFEKRLLEPFEQEAFVAQAREDVVAVMQKSARLALKVYVLTSIEAEMHKQLKDVADEAAIEVFCTNVRNLLLAAPFGAKSVLGVDPGLRTGCKLSLIEDSGKFLTSSVIHILSKDEREQSKKFMVEMLSKVKISAIAVGNGTGGRETEEFIKLCVKEAGVKIPVVMVSEAGASVYSASPVAREEFPDLDLTVRGAISIARRLQDPLAELVKIEPKSIGVGQYQHDVNPVTLKKSLSFVVDSCVNHVGVNLNTASEFLLSHVSGIGPGLAKAIVTFRLKNKLFKSRQDLLKVARFSQKTFEQAAGFLRIPDATNPLDNTGIHPERYAILEDVAKKEGCSVKDLIGPGVEKFLKHQELKESIGEFTFDDIAKDLEKPGRDPREQFVALSFREDIHELKDLKPGMNCPGVVTNVTNFGAFVDIGVHQDGLVHLSQLANHFVTDPNEVVKPGDRVSVRVISVDISKKQISLSMKSEDSEQRAPKADSRHSGRAPQRSSKNRPHHSQGGGGQGSGGRNAPRSREKTIDPNNPFSKLANLKLK